jgi:hypothetical protein
MQKNIVRYLSNCEERSCLNNSFFELWAISSGGRALDF